MRNISFKPPPATAKQISFGLVELTLSSSQCRGYFQLLDFKYKWLLEQIYSHNASYIFNSFCIFAALLHALIFTRIPAEIKLRTITLRRITEYKGRNSGQMSSLCTMVVITPVPSCFPAGAIKSGSCFLRGYKRQINPRPLICDGNFAIRQNRGSQSYAVIKIKQNKWG